MGLRVLVLSLFLFAIACAGPNSNKLHMRRTLHGNGSDGGAKGGDAALNEVLSQANRKCLPLDKLTDFLTQPGSKVMAYTQNLFLQSDDSDAKISRATTTRLLLQTGTSAAPAVQMISALGPQLKEAAPFGELLSVSAQDDCKTVTFTVHSSAASGLAANDTSSQTFAIVDGTNKNEIELRNEAGDESRIYREDPATGTLSISVSKPIANTKPCPGESTVLQLTEEFVVIRGSQPRTVEIAPSLAALLKRSLKSPPRELSPRPAQKPPTPTTATNKPGVHLRNIPRVEANASDAILISPATFAQIETDVSKPESFKTLACPPQ